MIPTIKVQADTPEGYTIINEDDFDPNQHQRYEDAPPSPRQAELEALYDAEGYRAIQAIAEPLNIEKPKGGWRDAISLIVEREQGAS